MTDTIIPPPPKMVNPSHIYWLGYPRLEEFAKHITPELPVYVSLILDPDPPSAASGSLLRLALYLVCQQADSSGTIHYWRSSVAWYDITSDGKPFLTSDANAAWGSAKYSYSKFRVWLTGAGFDLVEATYARPEDYLWLDGVADFLYKETLPCTS